jgi:hypothetical protein
MLSQLERWAPISGIVFVVLMVVGSFLVADVPDSDAPEQEIVDYLADSDNHTRNIIGAYLWVTGALAFLWFLVGLRSVLRGAEGGTGALSNLALGAGVAFAGCSLDGLGRDIRIGGLCHRVARCAHQRP